MFLTRASNKLKSFRSTLKPRQITPKRFAADPKVQEDIKEQLKESNVVIYMKGVPQQPMCGYSNAVVQVLTKERAKYIAYNVMSSDALRQGIKDYSDWPTIPQIFINGEFIGGCDILLSLHKEGKLGQMLKDADALIEDKEEK